MIEGGAFRAGGGRGGGGGVVDGEFEEMREGRRTWGEEERKLTASNYNCLPRQQRYNTLAICLPCFAAKTCAVLNHRLTLLLLLKRINNSGKAQLHRW